MSKREFKLNLEIERNYGKHKIRFGISEIVHVENGTERREAFNNLLLQLNDQIRLYEHTELGNVTLPQTSNAPDNGNSNNLETFTATHLVVENKQGKKYISVKGGKYAKFGVAVYEECQTDLPIEEYDYGVHDLTHMNLTAMVDVVDGKPRRTVSIR